MGALTKHVSVAATHSKAFSLPQSSAALKNKTKQNKRTTKKEVAQSVGVPKETAVVGISQYPRNPVGLLTSTQY